MIYKSFAGKDEVLKDSRRGREPPFIVGRIAQPQRGGRFVVSPFQGFASAYSYICES